MVQGVRDSGSRGFGLKGNTPAPKGLVVEVGPNSSANFYADDGTYLAALGWRVGPLGPTTSGLRLRV